MGNQQGKPGENAQNKDQKQENGKKKGNLKEYNEYAQGQNPNNLNPISQLKNLKAKDSNNPSKSPSALDSFRNKNNQPSNRNTPNLNNYGQKNNQDKGKINKAQQPSLYEEDDENQFMPLMKLPTSGQIRLRITLLELKLERSPKPHLKKNSSLYNSSMKWSKDARNIFTFVLKQDQNYQLVMEVDIQGNTLNNKDQYWSALCPINIPFGQPVKVGQMICVNWYCRLDQYDQLDNEQQSLGPSLKNIDFKISEQTFGKWGQKVPKNFYDQNKNQVIKKIYNKDESQKFVPYKQLSRYFDLKNVWRATTYIEQTSKYFRGWIIQVTDHNSMISISSQLHSDLKNREAFYAKTMFEKQFGTGDSQSQN